MNNDCGNCFFAGPGDSFECFDCWNGSNFIDICDFTWDDETKKYIYHDRGNNDDE